jgi:hypothetical protein
VYQCRPRRTLDRKSASSIVCKLPFVYNSPVLLMPSAGELSMIGAIYTYTVAMP